MASDSPRLPRTTELAHTLAGARLRPGDLAVDATVGNGHDTVFLAGAVGPGGRVLGFDVQAEALRATRQRLEAAGLADRVTLFEQCHSRLGETVEAGIRVAMFNLGYLPGGDKGRVTLAGTTLAALEAARSRLAPGGLITVIVYPGQPGGEVEAAEVEAWARELDQDAFTAVGYHGLNRAQSPPRLIAVERR